MINCACTTSYSGTFPINPTPSTSPFPPCQRTCECATWSSMPWLAAMTKTAASAPLPPFQSKEATTTSPPNWSPMESSSGRWNDRTQSELPCTQPDARLTVDATRSRDGPFFALQLLSFENFRHLFGSRAAPRELIALGLLDHGRIRPCHP